MTDTITCSYTFTPEEFRTTAVLSRRLVPLWKKLITVAMVLVIFTLGLLNTYNLFRPDGTFEYGGVMPAVFLVILGLYLITRILPIRALCSVRAFRKRRICNRLVQNSISREGIGSQTEDSAATLLWSGIGKAFESANGFAIFLTESRGTFIWYPFHGFPSPADVERARDLIRENVKNFRRI